MAAHLSSPNVHLATRKYPEIVQDFIDSTGLRQGAYGSGVDRNVAVRAPNGHEAVTGLT